ncbi:MAG: hypothetical protein Q4G67_05000 [Actinomycetia bacterium]|nr:hypothetical protein [Actinomycetes bacterium]
MTTATRARRERGAIGSEYVGSVLIAAIIAGAVFAVIAVTDVHTKAYNAICTILDMDCGSNAEDQAATDTFLPACEVNSTTAHANAELTVFSVNLGAGGEAVVAETRHPDGSTTWDVSLAVDGHVGAHFMAGADTMGEGMSAEVKAGLAASGGTEFEFASEQEAMQFLEEVAVEVGKTAVTPPIPGADWLVDQAVGLFRDDYDWPEPTGYFFQAGPQVSGSVEASAGLSAGLEAELSGALGMHVDPSETPPVYTYYLEGSGQLGSELGIVHGDGTAGTNVAISFQDGQPISAEVGITGDIRFGGAGTDSGPDVPFAGGTGSGSLGIEGHTTQHGSATLSLDLTNPANRTALADSFGSVGMPLLGDYRSDGYVNPVDATEALAQRFAEGPEGGATFVTQTWDGEDVGFDGGFFGGKGLTFGAGGGIGMDSRQSTGAWYFEPGVGMVQWARCT